MIRGSNIQGRADYRIMATDCELLRKRNKEQRMKILIRVFNPKVRLERFDIHQTALLKDDASEDWRPDVDQQDPDLLQIKTNDAIRPTIVPVRRLHPHESDSSSVETSDSADDEESHPSSQLRQRHVENSSSADEVEAEASGEDCSGADSNKNKYIHTWTNSICNSETEDSEDYDERLHPEFQLNLSDSEQQTEDGVKDWEKKRPPESDVQQRMPSKDALEDRRPDEDQPDSELPRIKKKKAKLKTPVSFPPVTLKRNDGGGAESSRTPGLNSQEDDLSSSETEEFVDVEKLSDDESTSVLLSDNGAKTRDCDKSLKESRAPESVPNGFNKHFTCSKCDKQFPNRRNLYKHRKCHPSIAYSDYSVRENFDGDSHSKIQKTQWL